MSEIKSDVLELKSVEVELKRARARVKELNKKKANLEEKIQEYIENNGLPGFKWKSKGLYVKAEEKEVRDRKKEKDKKQDATAVLRRHGVSDAEKVLDEMLEAMRGEKKSKTKLKINKYKDES